MVTVYYPALPCTRMPIQCTDANNGIHHDAHDWSPENANHTEAWHCYGSSVTPDGKGVGWAGGTEEPGDAMDHCQNNPATPKDA
jgi:hypothetical protein